MDMRYWIPAGAVSSDEEKEIDFLTDETQRTQSQASMRYWILAEVASHSQKQEMRTDLVGDETGSPDMTCKEKNEDDKQKGKAWAYSKETQTVIYNCYNYFRNESQYGAIKKTADATKVDRKTVTKIANDSPKSPKMPKNNRVAFDKVDGFTKDLIRRTVYEFYVQKRAPTVQMIFQKVKEKNRRNRLCFSVRINIFEKIAKDDRISFLQNQ